ncbi:dihydromonapterin reductase [Aestuariibacter salexigens]|uniref:dihydromonapterin reductase n=1 Tax=Aestuariibacter salexigens TaxID=226010 RepID=UPI0003FC18EF|nr:dihydromonapterin reductase [Aestuariibacter salexigens]
MTTSDYPILITGGAQRLGFAIAEALLAQNQPVIVTYRSRRSGVDILEAAGAVTLHADFADDQGILKCIETVRSKTKGLRAIIHNASDWVAERPGCDLSALMQRMIQVHVQAPYQINMALRDLLDTPEGFTDIIHMTDFVQDKGSKKHIAYAASKAALHNLTLSFSALLAPKTKVNSVAPALVMFNEGDDEEYRQKALRKSLLETCPGAQEAVKAVEYLLSSDYVTGRTMYMDGGRHLK